MFKSFVEHLRIVVFSFLFLKSFLSFHMTEALEEAQEVYRSLPRSSLCRPSQRLLRHGGMRCLTCQVPSQRFQLN